MLPSNPSPWQQCEQYMRAWMLSAVVVLGGVACLVVWLRSLAVMCGASVFVLIPSYFAMKAGSVRCPRCHESMLFRQGFLFDYPRKDCVHCGLPWGSDVPREDGAQTSDGARPS